MAAAGYTIWGLHRGRPIAPLKLIFLGISSRNEKFVGGNADRSAPPRRVAEIRPVDVDGVDEW